MHYSVFEGTQTTEEIALWPWEQFSLSFGSLFVFALFLNYAKRLASKSRAT